MVNDYGLEKDELEWIWRLELRQVAIFTVSS